MLRMIKEIKFPVFTMMLMLVASSSTAQPNAARSAREMAPIDITGYWVALVTEDWRFRMVAAPAGDYPGLPLTPAAQQQANAWDPELDEAAGEACRAYGAAGIMRIPTRLHITWANDNVLRIETDAGMQTRLLKFGAAQDMAGAGSIQGVSKANWELQAGGFGPPVPGRTIAVQTTDMRPGYFRRNGVPYGERAIMNEYFEMLTQENGNQYLIVLSSLEDPENFTEAVLTSTNFKREPDGSKWDPSPCFAQ